MRLLIILSIILSSTVALAAYADNVVVLNTTGKAPLNTVDQDGFMDRVAAEALRRIGYRLRTVHLPAERGLANSNAGIEDGEMARIAGLQHQYPNLLQVPEKIMSWEFNAFSARSVHFTGQWRDLEPYTVAYINGWKILEVNVPVTVESTRVKHPRQLFSLINKQRTDIIIYERWGGLNMAREQDMDIQLLMPPLAVRDMFIYLHKQHAALVKPLAAALAEMKRDGSYQQIYNETLLPLTKQYQAGDQS